MSAIVTDTVRCHSCSKFRSRLDVITFPSGVIECHWCAQKAEAARIKASDQHAAYPHCAVCHKLAEELAAETLTPMEPVAFYLCPIDGVHGMVCEGCYAKYYPKRRDLFKDTLFAQQQGL